jgi:hypothetical protein
VFESYPAELRPVLTSHRLRRRRHRGAASLLTGAALALGFAAMRPVPAGAATGAHAATAPTGGAPAPRSAPGSAPESGRPPPAAVPRSAA